MNFNFKDYKFSEDNSNGFRQISKRSNDAMSLSSSIFMLTEKKSDFVQYISRYDQKQ